MPWPRLQALTTAQHPELTPFAPDEENPWLVVRRRLEGLRLLTSGDQPEIARIHRLVASHVIDRANAGRDEEAVLAFVFVRGAAVAQSPDAPQAWELDALLVTLPVTLNDKAKLSKRRRSLALAAVDVSEKVKTYRSLAAAVSLLAPAHSFLQRLAESDPANAAWQRDLWVSFWLSR